MKWGDNINLNRKIIDFVVLIEHILPRVAECCDQIISTVMVVR
jgi:hypothetical protein